MMHEGIQCDPIQGERQGHEPFKIEIRPFSKAVSSAFYNGSWHLTTDSYKPGRAGSSMKLVRLKPQCPGPNRVRTARYNENFQSRTRTTLGPFRSLSLFPFWVAAEQNGGQG